MPQAPHIQPNHNNRILFERDGRKITATVISPITYGETVAAKAEDGTVYEVKNTEITRLVTALGVTVKLANGRYAFSAFCKRGR